MATISDLPVDLVEEEVLSKAPMTSLKSLRSTCKKFYALTKSKIFDNAVEEARQHFRGFMMKDSKICSFKFDLEGIRKEVDDDRDFLEQSIKQVSILDQIEISNVIHCDGLLLCVTKDNSRLLVWNPYLGQTRWIQPLNKLDQQDRYGLGYDNNRNHKILRVLDDDLGYKKSGLGYEIYDFISNSWKVLDVSPDWDTLCHIHRSRGRSASLKDGNTYFLAQKMEIEEDVYTLRNFLLCFDYTRENFGPRLPLPFHSFDGTERVTLSCVRDEQLAVLYIPRHISEIMEIWITTKIQPNAVSWSNFLKVDMTMYDVGSFFIDQEKKVAVVFTDSHYYVTRYQQAHIIGQDGYCKPVLIQDDATNVETPDEPGYAKHKYRLPLVCSSYVPSLVQLQINQRSKRGKRKERD